MAVNAATSAIRLIGLACRQEVLFARQATADSGLSVPASAGAAGLDGGRFVSLLVRADQSVSARVEADSVNVIAGTGRTARALAYIPLTPADSHRLAIIGTPSGRRPGRRRRSLHGGGGGSALGHRHWCRARPGSPVLAPTALTGLTVWRARMWVPTGPVAVDWFVTVLILLPGGEEAVGQPVPG